MPHHSPVALVTGSSRGIGRAIALELSRAGYGITVNYVRQAEAAQAVVDEIRGQGGAAVAVGASVAEAAGRSQLIDRTLAEFGRLDVLVNNAGITSPGRKDLLEASEASWDEVFATNLKGPFFLAQVAAKAMLALRQAGIIPGGILVQVSSISAFAASADRADYCLAKSAASMLTWLFAARLADENIRAFEICPGIIASDMTAPVQAKYETLIAQGLSPMRRWGEGADVARAVRAVCSPDFAFCTGQTIHVDGGFHIRRL